MQPCWKIEYFKFSFICRQATNLCHIHSIFDFSLYPNPFVCHPEFLKESGLRRCWSGPCLMTQIKARVPQSRCSSPCPSWLGHKAGYIWGWHLLSKKKRINTIVINFNAKLWLLWVLLNYLGHHWKDLLCLLLEGQNSTKNHSLCLGGIAADAVFSPAKCPSAHKNWYTSHIYQSVKIGELKNWTWFKHNPEMFMVRIQQTTVHLHFISVTGFRWLTTMFDIFCFNIVVF